MLFYNQRPQGQKQGTARWAQLEKDNYLKAGIVKKRLYLAFIVMLKRSSQKKTINIKQEMWVNEAKSRKCYG